MLLSSPGGSFPTKRQLGQGGRKLAYVARIRANTRICFAVGQFAWWLAPLAVIGIAALWESIRWYAAYLIVHAVVPLLFMAAYRADGREVYGLQTLLALANRPLCCAI